MKTLDIEILAINILNQQLHCTLVRARIKLDDGILLEVSGFDQINNILAEVYTGIDGMSEGQYQEVMNNAFKLIFWEKLKGKPFRKVLLFVDESVRTKFKAGVNYFTLKEFGIETMSAEIPENIKEKLRIKRSEG